MPVLRNTFLPWLADPADGGALHTEELSAVSHYCVVVRHMDSELTSKV
jgi:hypothetical protein